jgi:hypothetical protein
MTFSHSNLIQYYALSDTYHFKELRMIISGYSNQNTDTHKITKESSRPKKEGERKRLT